MTAPSWRRASAWLLASAAGRMGKTRSDWADAMLAEADICSSERDRLIWAWGCWVASLRASIDPGGLVYACALPLGLALMTAYEWRADESRETVAVLCLIALALGAVRPRQALLSGALVGLVVAGVIGFEALSGIRPAYEAQAQTLASSIYWTILVAPSLCSAIMGARIGRWLRPGRP
jgi:hypothetical protein